jgi:hypothetical protein
MITRLRLKRSSRWCRRPRARVRVYAIASNVSAMISPEGQERRQRLRRLDDCLDVLEQAHELDLTVVSDRMASALSERVPTIHEGMLIADAIEEVLRQQEPYMVQIRPEMSRRMRRRRDPFDVRLLLNRR